MVPHEVSWLSVHIYIQRYTYLCSWDIRQCPNQRGVLILEVLIQKFCSYHLWSDYLYHIIKMLRVACITSVFWLTIFRLLSSQTFLAIEMLRVRSHFILSIYYAPYPYRRPSDCRLVRFCTSSTEFEIFTVDPLGHFDVTPTTTSWYCLQKGMRTRPFFQAESLFTTE